MIKTKINFKKIKLLHFSLDSRISSLVLWIFFSCFILFFKILFHELWKDEWQSWLVARDMPVMEMFGFLYYEGHPALWYLYLKLFAGFKQLFGIDSDSILIIAAHMLLVTITYYILFTKLRMPQWLKLLVGFTYFIFFEYAVVNRGYILIILFEFLILTNLESKQTRLWLLPLLIFLMCQTEVYGVIVAGSIVFYVFYQNNAFKFRSLKQEYFYTLLTSFLVGAILFTLSVFPRGHSDELAHAYNPTKQSIPTSAGKAFVGMLANTFYIGSLDDVNVTGVTSGGILISVLCLILLSLLFFRQKSLFVTYLFFLLSFFLFSSIFYSGGIRQWGIGFVFFIFCLELLFFNRKAMNWFRAAIILPILFFQMRYSYLAFLKDYNNPFSNAKEAAEFLDQNVPDGAVILAINEFQCTPVVGYLNSKVYSLPDGESFTYFRWLEKIYIPTEEEISLFAKYMNRSGLIVLSSKPLSSTDYPRLDLWKKFDHYNLKKENYWLYLFVSDKSAV